MSKKYFAFSNTESPSKEKISLPSSRNNHKLKVKFMHRGLKRGASYVGFLRQFPESSPHWGDCLFDFDADCKDYDWLVVYQDLPKNDGYFVEEKLCCPRERTLLITGEAFNYYCVWNGLSTPVWLYSLLPGTMGHETPERYLSSSRIDMVLRSTIWGW